LFIPEEQHHGALMDVERIAAGMIRE